MEAVVCVVGGLLAMWGIIPLFGLTQTMDYVDSQVVVGERMGNIVRFVTGDLSKS